MLSECDERNRATWTISVDVSSYYYDCQQNKHVTKQNKN